MPEALTNPLVLQGAGLAVAALVLLSGLVRLFDALGRSRALRRQERRAQAELELRVERARWGAQRARALSEWRWEGSRKFVVDQVVKENQAGDIRSFYLAPHDDRPLPDFKPGQFLTFHVRIPTEDRPVVRCYSLSGAYREEEKKYRVSIKRLEGGLCSTFFHQKLRQGDILDVNAPGGSFFLDMERDWPVVLIGGGVGVTPVLSMLEAIDVSQQHSRPTTFVYGVKTAGEVIQGSEVVEIANRNPNVQAWFCYSDPEGHERTLIDQSRAARETARPDDWPAVHHVGRRVSVDWLFDEVLPLGAEQTHHFYCCGPPPMMEAVLNDLEARGVPEKQIHSEQFGPASVSKKRQTSVTKAVAKAKLRFDKSSEELEWDGSAPNILALAEEHGIDIPWGCKVGHCHECKVAVKSGKVRYVQEPPKQPEPGTCLTCQAVPDGDVTIDA